MNETLIDKNLIDKTICELFAGVGGFRLGFEKINTDWKTVWFSQWEPKTSKQYAHDCYVKHFGDSVDVNGELHTGEDISTINKKNIPNHTLLVGGFPCLSADTLILTQNGYKPIIEVKPDDMVLSHDNEWHSVVRFMEQGVKEVYRLKAPGVLDLKATANHRFYVRKAIKVWNNDVHRYDRVLLDAEWKSVEDLLDADDTYFLGCPINQKSSISSWNGVEYNINKNTVRMLHSLNLNNSDFWYIVGRYLGNGWLQKQQESDKYRLPYNAVIICCNKNKTNVLKNHIERVFHCCVSHEKTIDKLCICNSEFAMFLLQFGCYAYDKYLPSFVYDLPQDLLCAMLDGYIDSDGSFNEKQNCWKIASVNLGLLYGIARCIHKVYGALTTISMMNQEENRLLENRMVHQKMGYSLSFKKQAMKSIAVFEDDYIWVPIRHIDYVGEEAVYDIEVEGSHSFIANNCITHNCQDYSVAQSLNTSKGIEGKKGVLWWQIKKVLEIKQPPFVLLENVDRLLKSPAKQKGRDFGIILSCFASLGYSVEWRVVDASHYKAAQKRKRTFIFAYRNDIYKQNSNPLSIIENGFMAKAFPVKAVSRLATVTVSLDLLNINNTFSFPFENAGFMSNGKITTAKVIDKEEGFVPLKDILQSNVSSNYYLSQEQKEKIEYLKSGKKIDRISKDGYEWIYSEGPVAFPDYLDKPGRTMLTSEATINRSTHIVDDNGLRFITPIEAERLNGFDDNWTVGMPDKMRYYCMGNALVVSMISRMATVLNDIIKEINNKENS